MKKGFESTGGANGDCLLHARSVDDAGAALCTLAHPLPNFRTQENQHKAIHRPYFGALTHRPILILPSTICGAYTTAKVIMSKGKNGNKEAKKPKRDASKSPAGDQALVPPPVASAHSAKKK